MIKFIWIVGIVLIMTSCSFTPSKEDIVNGRGDITNLDTFEQFVVNVENGVEDEVRIVNYTDEGDAIIHDVKHENGEITSIFDSTRDEFGSKRVTTTTCQSIEVDKLEYGDLYKLADCDEEGRGPSLLLIRK